MCASRLRDDHCHGDDITATAATRPRHPRILSRSPSTTLERRLYPNASPYHRTAQPAASRSPPERPPPGRSARGTASSSRSRARPCWKKRDRVRVAPVLAADAELQVRASPRARSTPPAARASRRRACRSSRTGCGRRSSSSMYRARKLRLDVVAREAERGLREVVGAEREEVGLLGDAVRHEAGARQLDHRADDHVEVLAALLLDHPPTSSRISSSSFS